METIRRAETINTPAVILDKNSNEFTFTGRSLPEDPKEFYSPIFEWFDKYLRFPNKGTRIIFDLEYLNTASSKMILELLYKLRRSIDEGWDVVIEWFYDVDDEEQLEAGKDFAEMVNVPVIMTCKQDSLV